MVVRPRPHETVPVMMTPLDDISSPQVPTALMEAVGSMRAPVVIAHVVPDADALGSMLALARAVSDDNACPKVSIPQGCVSQRLKFMPEIANVPVATPADFEAADGFIVVDTAKKPRCNVGKELKETDWSTGRRIVNIDHHATNTQFGDVNWVVPEASSTAELVFYMLAESGRPIDEVSASLLFAGIQTDTVGFSLPTTSASTLAASARLVALGANVADLGERLFRSQRQSEFDLLRTVYANTQTLADGAISYSSASFDEIQGAGCAAADIDDQINIPRSLNGVRLAMLFTEGNKGKTRINFRGSGNVTVVELAAQFKGGGHSQSAGAILDCPLHVAMEQVLPAAEEHLKQFDPS